MNWYWIDRFTVFESGKRAVALKAITRAEGHLRAHFPFHALAPASLIIEGLAQTAGLTVNEATQFEKKVVLGKIPKIKFYQTEIVPGDMLTYHATIDYVNEEGSMATVSARRGEELIVEGELIFAHLGAGFAQKDQFADGDLEDLLRAYGVYDIGVDANGNPLVDPATQRNNKES
jgi:3-hydroxyacyl-[acyl-carrier-protein] dehydratase